jgi:glycosyltransferase involved in cell wall biosynthesis
MIGDGYLLQSSQDLAHSLGISENVEFMGVCSAAQVALSLREARAFVQHSIRPVGGDSEGTPVAILEAAATGLPIVSTLHGGIKDVVQNGENGYLVAEGDVNSMATFMTMLAKDSELAGKLGAEARRRIAAQFSLDQSIRKLFEVLKASVSRERI